MYRVIRAFWKDEGMSRKHDDVLPVLVRTLSKLAELYADDRDEAQRRRALCAELIGELENAGDQLGQRWTAVGWGARVWDGVKRAWRFVTDFIRRTVASIWDLVTEKLVTVIRAAHHAVAQAYSLLHRGFRMFSDSVEFLFAREVSGSTPEIAMRHDRDFDFQVFTSEVVSASSVTVFLDGLQRAVHRFHVAARVCRVFLAIALATARLAAGPWAWWSLVRTLIRLHGEITEQDADSIAVPLAV